MVVNMFTCIVKFDMGTGSVIIMICYGCQLVSWSLATGGATSTITTIHVIIASACSTLNTAPCWNSRRRALRRGIVVLLTLNP